LDLKETEKIRCADHKRLFMDRNNPLDLDLATNKVMDNTLCLLNIQGKRG